ncbi:Imm49 family immunity protein, partial [Streptomyces cyaneofuscatus]
PINLFYHYVRNDRDGFTPALADALKLHKTYWTLNKDRAKDSRQKFHCPRVWRNGSNMSRFTVHIAEPPPSPVLHIVSASVAAVQAPHRPQVKGRSRFPRTAA